MKFSLVPTLTAEDRERLKTWLRASLANSRLNAIYPSTLGDRIAVYVDNRAYRLYPGEWNLGSYDGIHLFVGSDGNGGRSQAVTTADRLAVLSTVITLADLWTDLVDDFSPATSRVLLESYNEIMAGLVQTQGPASGLMFSASRQQVAARFGESWHLPNGEVVDVTGPEWADAAVVG